MKSFFLNDDILENRKEHSNNISGDGELCEYVRISFTFNGCYVSRYV